MEELSGKLIARTAESVKREIKHLGEKAAKEAAIEQNEKLAQQIEKLDVHSADELNAAIIAIRKEMRSAADEMDYERATELRDRAKELEELRQALL